MPQAIRALKDAAPDLVVISDMCFCEYTSHGHCSIINLPEDEHYDPHLPEGYLLNDPARWRCWARLRPVHAEAGADIIAPSGMIDGMVGAIRAALGAPGLNHVSSRLRRQIRQRLLWSLRDAAESPRRYSEPQPMPRWTRPIAARP
ncbi:MAG: hypothetical protein R2873_26345 [Caldilineaceae bacterium]